jgi:hypothetical protein
MLKRTPFEGCSKPLRYKAPEIPRSESYSPVRRSDEGRGQRRRWAVFSKLLGISLADQQVQDIGVVLSAILDAVSHLSNKIAPQPPYLPIRKGAGQVGLGERKNVEGNAGVENADVEFGIISHFANHFDLALVLARIGILEDVQESLLSGELDVMDFAFRKPMISSKA